MYRGSGDQFHEGQCQLLLLLHINTAYLAPHNLSFPPPLSNHAVRSVHSRSVRNLIHGVVGIVDIQSVWTDPQLSGHSSALYENGQVLLFGVTVPLKYRIW